MKLVSVENLSVRYGGNTILQRVDLDIEKGEIVTIVGPNGSGKTSLLKAIIGAVEPAKGCVTLKPGLKIGYVPQRLNFNPTLPITVERLCGLLPKLTQDLA
jgi:zinc transport system ATP-binding protein